jgi:hypothetical protein
MAPIKKEGNYFLLTIDQDLVSEDYLQRFLEWLEFRALTRQNEMTEVQAEELAEESKASWWAANKDQFLSK